jgi:hypothetical protein
VAKASPPATVLFFSDVTPESEYIIQGLVIGDLMRNNGIYCKQYKLNTGDNFVLFVEFKET